MLRARNTVGEDIHDEANVPTSKLKIYERDERHGRSHNREVKHLRWFQEFHVL